MLAEIPPEELSAVLEAVAAETLAATGVDHPPVDAFAVARALGITVAADDRQRGRARYVRLGAHRPTEGKPAILLHGDPRPERRQWAIAHEIGEHTAHQVFSRLGVDPWEASPNARETIANQLAGRLLLPGDWFAADAADCGWDLFGLKSRYATASHELIARRMLECPPPVIISIFDQGEVSFRRSNVPGQAPPPSSAEMECWRIVHTYARTECAYDGTSAIHGWPIHEEGWRREILRTEVDEVAIGG